MKKQLCDVCAVDALPVFESCGAVIEEGFLSFLGVLVLGFMAGFAGDACVVDQDGEMGFLGLEFGDRSVNVCFVGDVAAREIIDNLKQRSLSLRLTLNRFPSLNWPLLVCAAMVVDVDSGLY